VDCPRSTVSRWLQRLGLGRPGRESRPPVLRYERATPGEPLHVDIKPLGRSTAVRRVMNNVLVLNS